MSKLFVLVSVFAYLAVGINADTNSETLDYAQKHSVDLNNHIDIQSKLANLQDILGHSKNIEASIPKVSHKKSRKVSEKKPNFDFEMEHVDSNSTEEDVQVTNGKNKMTKDRKLKNKQHEKLAFQHAHNDGDEFETVNADGFTRRKKFSNTNSNFLSEKTSDTNIKEKEKEKRKMATLKKNTKTNNLKRKSVKKGDKIKQVLQQESSDGDEQEAFKIE